MDTTQGFLLEDMNRAARSALEVLARFRNEKEASEEFVGSILARWHSAGQGALILVGCSPVAKPELIVRDILRSIPGINLENPAANSILMFAAPPLIESPRSHLRLLHDRYLTEAGAVGLCYKHQPRYPASPPVQRSTETEALISLLRVRKIRTVVITHADNLLDPDRATSRRDRLFRHTADIARRADVSHLLVGDRESMLSVASTSHESDRIKVVVQRVYDPLDKGEVGRFAAILNAYQQNLGSCADIVLAKRAVRIMQRTGGDPCRVAAWLCDALCDAARGAEKLGWKHLNRTGPRLNQINAANRDLARYLAWQKFESLDTPLALEKPEASPCDRPTKPGGRKPTRDPVPRPSISTAA